MEASHKGATLSEGRFPTTCYRHTHLLHEEPAEQKTGVFFYLVKTKCKSQEIRLSVIKEGKCFRKRFLSGVTLPPCS